MVQTSRRFGETDVTLLQDGLFEAPLDLVVHQRGPAARDAAIARLGTPSLQLAVNCLLLRRPDGITLVDSGAGTAWGPGFGLALAALAADGITPDQVDRVLLTHLHADHVLGVFDGEQARFPNAEILVPRIDLAFYGDEANREGLAEVLQGGFAVAAQLKRLYGDRLREIEGGPVVPGIVAIPLPGHSPGQIGYLVEDPADDLLFGADLLHLGMIQPADPEAGLVFDLDPALATRTRQEILARAAESGWIVAGAHIAGFNRVRIGVDGPELVPA